MRRSGWACAVLLACGDPAAPPSGGVGAPPSEAPQPVVVAVPGGSAAGLTTSAPQAATQVGDEGTAGPDGSRPAEPGPGVDWASRCPPPAMSDLALWQSIPGPFRTTDLDVASHAVRPGSAHVLSSHGAHARWSPSRGVERLPLGPLAAAPGAVVATDLGLLGLVDHGDAVERVVWAPGVGWAEGERLEVDEVHALTVVGDELAALVTLEGAQVLLRDTDTDTDTDAGFGRNPLPDEVPHDAVLGATAEGTLLVAWFEGTTLQVFDEASDTIETAWSAPNAGRPEGLVQLAGHEGVLAALFDWDHALWVVQRTDAGWVAEELVSSVGVLYLGYGSQWASVTVDDRFAGALGLSVDPDGLQILYSELTREGSFSVVAGDDVWEWDSPGLRAELVAARWSADQGLHDPTVLATGLPALRGQLVSEGTRAILRLHVLEHCEAPLSSRAGLVWLDPAVWPAR